MNFGKRIENKSEVLSSVTEQDLQKELYLRGVDRLVGEGFVDKPLRYVTKYMIDDRMPRVQRISDAYYHMSRAIIEANNSDEKRLPINLLIGLSESLADRVWFRNVDTLGSSRDSERIYWIQRDVADSLFGVFGEDILAGILLTRPDYVYEKLSGIEYGGTTLLDYLETNLDAACIDPLAQEMADYEVGTHINILNCTEAISDCSELLGDIKRRRELKEKSKVLTKSLEYERDFD